MYDKVKVTYLLNSGFILEIGDCAIIFDYYQDEKNIVDKIIQNKKEEFEKCEIRGLTLSVCDFSAQSAMKSQICICA